MMPDIPIWWILGAAASFAAWWVTRVFGAGINARIFVNVVNKLLRAKNVSRAIKLCVAAGDVPFGKGTKAALLASVSREDDVNRPATYRGSRPVSMDAVQSRIRARYDEAFTLAAAPLKISFFVAIPSFFLFIGALYLALTQLELDWPSIGAASGGLLFTLYVGWSHLEILSAKNAGFEALWPSFEAIYHDRHTINIDDKPADPWKTPPTTNASLDVNKPRITLEILEPGKPLRSETIDQSIIKIGNYSSAHVQLSAKQVARMHAVIEIADGKALIIDLGAEKTTTVNGENVNKRELANGDLIGIGDAEIVVRLETNDVTSSPQ